ncbi:cupin domain-containing protein [Paraburkholderia sp. SIMBA_055]|jgi:quercetin dioxygenase-like cupin family protein|uniref:Quercetin dioxygenase-like cupin family protein n=1 Tax=Paraburkholderia graminis TaxID=60548 RepID=A0ABD5CRV6_9BURK|nr:cupin domain-containing protein [Paraburkholderia graminis]MDR6206729.1 quercetin dioxygenase-like cupin family protein [Paraburkholderia graminis]
MKLHTLIAAATLAGFGMLATSQPALAADSTGQAAAAAETITPAFAEAIANVPGKKMTALVVDYAPGGKSSPHRHGKAFVVAYVLSGAIRSGVDGKEAQVFHAGEHWIEKPGAHHTVSENASDTEPARLLAIFVADTNDNKLVTFDHKK